jgi:CTP:molybdopterin cytidylyltransferase MocA
MLVMRNLCIRKRTLQPSKAVQVRVLSPELLVVILAAGASRRLGSAKQLVSVDGEPLLRRQCLCALDARVGQVLVVLGCDADRLRQVVADLPVDVRVNDEWQEGMASTLRRAVGAASERRAASLLLPCDQYRITSCDLRALRDAWRRSPSGACVSRWDDCVGPPAILPFECYGEVLELRGDTGARGVLYHPARPRPLEVVNARAAYDLDCMEDVAIARASGSAVALEV